VVPRKLFIVAPDRPDVLASLLRAIGHEPGVQIFYDRRAPGGSGPEQRVERRQRLDIETQLSERGFAVVNLPGSPAGRAHRLGRG
jgi:hypothetical protein